MMDDLKERLRANGLDECDEAIDRIEELEQDVKAVQRREADANRAAMKHLRSLELERIKSANYAEFSNQWRRKCEALEARIAKADALAEAVTHERELVCQDMGMQLDAACMINNALATYREGSDT
jgi:hypothetical protein